MKPGEDPPERWVNDRLVELGETWRVGILEHRRAASDR
jgi:hypothetical protein